MCFTRIIFCLALCTVFPTCRFLRGHLFWHRLTVFPLASKNYPPVRRTVLTGPMSLSITPLSS